MRLTIIAAGVLALAASACSNAGQQQQEAKLRDALASADVSLGEAIAIAEDTSSMAYAARINVNSDPSYSVRTEVDNAATKHSISLAGEVLAAEGMGSGGSPCGSRSMQELVAIAEAEVGGEAAGIVPDDDGGCAFEVQVLTSSDLMEVKVSGSGDALEVEPSDEDGSGED